MTTIDRDKRTREMTTALAPEKKSALRAFARGVITEQQAAEALGAGSPLVHHEYRGPGLLPLALTVRGRGVAAMLASEYD